MGMSKGGACAVADCADGFSTDGFAAGFSAGGFAAGFRASVAASSGVSVAAVAAAAAGDVRSFFFFVSFQLLRSSFVRRFFRERVRAMVGVVVVGDGEEKEKRSVGRLNRRCRRGEAVG